MVSEMQSLALLREHEMASLEKPGWIGDDRGVSAERIIEVP